MKRKTGNRAGWPRIDQQLFTQVKLEDDDFQGYVTLLKFIKVHSPLQAKFTKVPISLVEDGSYMMQHIPFNENFAITTFISPEKKIVQWYIDMTNGMGVEDGIPYFDDLYLDLIVVPSGEMIDKDMDELEEALSSGDINKDQYELAWKTFRELKEAIRTGTFSLMALTKPHFEQLVKQLEKS